MDGILNINKPQGLTSFDVVARVKRITCEKHTGHAGTLDPLATGILPVCLGQATRVIEYLFDETKVYRAEFELGVVTDTYDSTGKVLRTGDCSGINRAMIEKALERFRGSILQTPPMYSAVKHKGQPLYKLARSGIEVDRKSRPVRIFKLDILNWTPPVLALEVECGKGTYIRSLAYDLGEALGCGAVMKSLVRSRVGPFTLDDSITLSQLETAFGQGYGRKYLYPIDSVLLSFNALVVNEEQRCSLIHGSPLVFEQNQESDLPRNEPGVRSRVYSLEGQFIGMVKYDAENHRWQPEKIFFKGCPCSTPSSAIGEE